MLSKLFLILLTANAYSAISYALAVHIESLGGKDVVTSCKIIAHPLSSNSEATPQNFIDKLYGFFDATEHSKASTSRRFRLKTPMMTVTDVESPLGAELLEILSILSPSTPVAEDISVVTGPAQDGTFTVDKILAAKDLVYSPQVSDAIAAWAGQNVVGDVSGVEWKITSATCTILKRDNERYRDGSTEL